MQGQANPLLNEERFPGNSEAWVALTNTAKRGNLICLVGAGASAPKIPSWNEFLTHLVGTAHKRGLCNEIDKDHYLQQINNDPLQVADDLEEMFGNRQFRAFLTNFFSVNDTTSGECHDLIAQGPYRALVTLNYDMGLESAFVAQRQTSALSLCSSNEYEVQQWSSGSAFKDGRMPIFHLHGTARNPDSIILTATDYHRFYSGKGKTLATELWRNQSLLVVGFGFRDPFLTAVADSTLRDLATEDCHFAFIGCRPGDSITPTIRRQFTKKYRLNPVFYPIRISTKSGQTEDHTDLLSLFQLFNSAAAHPPPSTAIKVSKPEVSRRGTPAYLNEVLTSPAGVPLYLEPRLRDRVKQINPKSNEEAVRFSVDDLVTLPDSLWILSHPETGATTLCKRLLEQFQTTPGVTAALRSAELLPSYKAKLLKEFNEERASITPSKVLILDDFNSSQHERLIREISALNIFSRIILISQNRPGATLERASSLDAGIEFKRVFIWPVERADIRTLAQKLFDSGDAVFISSIVDKTYRDLVALRIPLTPVNVIMYLRILYREGDFQPLNRVQIVHRFLNEVLRSPSDNYASAFNAKNKIDLISSFAFGLYESQSVKFSIAQWENYCSEYQTAKLLEFDPRKILADLLRDRVVVQEVDGYRFRYAAYYHFFLGAYVSSKESALRKFIASEGYLQAEGTGEVICALAAEGGLLLEDITRKLNLEVEIFWNKYINQSFNPYDSIKWRQDKDQEEALWKKIEAESMSAPRDPKELDEIKACVISEDASRDQSIVFRNFVDCERRLIALSSELARMLKASDSIDGRVKVNATKALHRTQLVILQIALLLAPRIAESRYFYYKGILFINNELDKEVDTKKRLIGILNSGVEMIAAGAAEYLSSVKLGGVFKEIAKDPSLTKFEHVLNFACLLKAKPVGWEDTLSKIIKITERDSWYLSSMLELLMADIIGEVNTGADREATKRLVALLKAKRGLKKEDPSNKAVNRVLGRLVSQDYFSKPNQAGAQETDYEDVD